MRKKETYKSCSLDKTSKPANETSLTNVKNDLMSNVFVLFQWHFCDARANPLHNYFVLEVFSLSVLFILTLPHFYYSYSKI